MSNIFVNLASAFLLAVGTSSFSMAQEAPQGALEATPEAEESIGFGELATDPDEAARKCLVDNELKQGYSKQSKTFVAIAGADMVLDGNETSDQFLSRREDAYELAMQDARSQMVQFIAAEISTSVSSYYEEPSEESAANLMPSAAAVKKLVDEMGKTEQERKAVLLKDELKSAVAVSANHEVGAMQCFQSFESVAEGGRRGRVVVVTMLSPNSRSLQAAMLGKGQTELKEKGVATQNWLAALKAEGSFLCTLGPVMRINERGELCVVVFGHASARANQQGVVPARARDGAMRRAELQARQKVRQFAGTMVSFQGDMTSGYSLTEYMDASRTFTSADSLRTAVNAVADKLALPGLATLGTSSTKHPSLVHAKDGGMVYSVAMEWNLSSLEAANELGAICRQLRGSKGGSGAAGIIPASGSSGSGSKEQPDTKGNPANPSKPKPGSSGSGGTGSKG